MIVLVYRIDSLLYLA